MSKTIRTSAHRTCVYIYVDNDLVASVEDQGEGDNPWRVMLVDEDGSGKQVASCPTYTDGLVHAGTHLQNEGFLD